MGGLKPVRSTALTKRVPAGATGETAPTVANFNGATPVSATVWQIWQATQVLQWLLPSATRSPAGCMAACSGQSLLVFAEDSISTARTDPAPKAIGCADWVAARPCTDISTDMTAPAQPRTASKAIIRKRTSLRINPMIPVNLRSSNPDRPAHPQPAVNLSDKLTTLLPSKRDLLLSH